MGRHPGTCVPRRRRVRLRSRTGRDISHVYPELAGMAAVVDARQAVLDGEVVAFGDDGWPEFEVLQQRMNISSAAQARLLAASVPVSYLAFDLLWRDGRPLIDQPYADRRAALDGLGLAGGTGRPRRRSPGSPEPTPRPCRCSSGSKASWPSGCSRATNRAAGRRPG